MDDGRGLTRVYVQPQHETDTSSDRVYTMSEAPPVVTTATESAIVARLDDGGPNVIGFAAAAALTAAVDQASEAERPLVILGREGMFSAGFDLNVLNDDVEAFADLVLTGAELLRHIVAAPVPVVIGASGHAVAMGALLLMAADYRIGAEGRFKIGLNEVSIGMTLPHFALALAESRLSKRHFLRATTMAELHRPDAACDVGYLDEVVAPEGHKAATLAKAEALSSSLSSTAFAGTKERARGDLAAALSAAIAKDRAGFEASRS